MDSRTLDIVSAGTPLRSQYVQTDGSVTVNVRVIDPRGKGHFRRLKRIVSRKVDRQEKHSALIRGVRRTHNRRLPVEQVVADWSGRTLRRRIPFQGLPVPF